MMTPYKEAAVAVACSQGWQHSIIANRGKKDDCDAYVATGIWPVDEWGEPKPKSRKVTKQTEPAFMQISPGDVLERARVLRVKRVRGQVLLGLEDERLALERINEILNGIANVLPWVTIQPNLWPLPESVFPLEDDNDPADPVEDPRAAQMAAGAKLAAAFMQQ